MPTSSDKEEVLREICNINESHITMLHRLIEDHGTDEMIEEADRLFYQKDTEINDTLDSVSEGWDGY